MKKVITLTETQLLNTINKIVKEEMVSARTYKPKRWSRDPQDRAAREAQQDISSHYYEPGDPMGDYGTSEEFRKHTLPYDTEFKYPSLTDEVPYEEELEELGNKGKGLASVVSRNYQRMGDSFTKRKPDEGFEYAEKWETKSDIAKGLMDMFGIPAPMAKEIVDYVLSDTEVLKEQHVGNSFSTMDRRMLSAIYDVIVKGGAAGGYKGGRRRSIQPLGGIPKHS